MFIGAVQPFAHLDGEFGAPMITEFHLRELDSFNSRGGYSEFLRRGKTPHPARPSGD